MIKQVGILYSAIIITSTVQAQWNLMKSPTQSNLNAISIIDMNSGWIAGDNGTLLFMNSGEWIEHPKITNKNLNSVCIVSKNDIWAAGEEGIVLHYNGIKWESFNTPTTNDLHSISFQDSERGIAVGDLGTILIYERGCWTLLENEIRGNLYSALYKKDEAWFGGGLECDNVPIMNINMNKKSEFNSFDNHAVIKSIIFTNPDDGWAAGSPSILLHFDGLKWEKVSDIADFSSLNSVFFSNECNGISVGYGGSVITYSDNGWTREETITKQNLNGAIITGNNYYAVGDSGTIISKNLNTEIIPDDFITDELRKIQVYPNPCDEFLNIEIPFIIDNFNVLISVSNLFGKIILKNELKLSNRYMIYPLTTSNFIDGLYLINVTIAGKTITMKFIVRH